jgi:hypothetical protein
VLKGIFGIKGDRVAEVWRGPHNEELHNAYSLPSIIRITKSRKVRWTGDIARMGEKRNAYRTLVESHKERDH